MPETRVSLNRRAFAAAAAAPLAPYFVPAKLLAGSGEPGPNDRINIGVIGIGIRGKYQIANIPAEGRVAAVCDWYLPRAEFVLSDETSSRYAPLLADFRERDSASCTAYQDYREMIAEADLDAVFITACDHHHCHAGVLACEAGLDVYVEKPLSVYVAEGRALVDAARRNDCIVQVGSQQRTMEINRYACGLVREGRLGKIHAVTLFNYPGPLDMEPLPEAPIPDGGDWDLYCGPTTARPYNQRLWAKEEFAGRRFAWRGWDMWRDYSGHLMTNHAAHSADMAQLALGKDETGPVEIEPLTHRLQRDLQTTPVVMRYADGTELRFISTSRLEMYDGEQGRMRMMRNFFQVDPPELAHDAPGPEVVAKWEQGGEHVARPHIQNWLDCLRSRKQPNAPVEAGHRTATLCHLANISRTLGRKLQWDPAAERFVNDPAADALLDRPRRAGWEFPPPPSSNA